MLEALKIILEIQELDMKLLRLVRLKRERQRELANLQDIKDDLQVKAETKEREILGFKKDIKVGEEEVAEVQTKIKKLETQQSSVRKVEEFTALTQEMAATDRERAAKEQKLSDLIDKLAAEEDALKILKEGLSATTQNSKALEAEITDSISRINEEGSELKKQRDGLAKKADTDTLRIYERLFRNKRDRVVVPIENRCCSGCHIMITAQDENLVRKGERLVYCEHCSRIHYWQESKALEGTGVATKQRRRRSPSKTS